MSRVLTCVPVGCWCLLCLCSSFFCAQSDSWLYLYRYCIHSLTSLVRKTYTHTGSKSILLYNIMYNIISVLLYNSRDIPLNTTSRHPHAPRTCFPPAFSNLSRRTNTTNARVSSILPQHRHFHTYT